MQYRIQSQFIPKLVIQVSKSIPLKTHTIQYSLEVVFSDSCPIPYVIFLQLNFLLKSRRNYDYLFSSITRRKLSCSSQMLKSN